MIPILRVRKKSKEKESEVRRCETKESEMSWLEPSGGGNYDNNLFP
jgi:hypothetical protein